MGNLILILTALLVLWNLCTFGLMALDKRKAIKGKRRIPEKTLLLTAWCLGGVGSFCGMVLCSHKTKHLRFVILLPLAAVFTLAAAALLTVWLPAQTVETIGSAAKNFFAFLPFLGQKIG